MLTKDIKKTIDNARNVLVGKIPNPQAQIEQITIAMIYKFMDDMDIETVELGGNREFFVEELSEYAWSKIMSPQLGNEARMNLYTEALDKLQLSNRIPKLFRDIFKGAYLPFRDGQTLTLFLKEINDLSYSNSENLGNGFEYLLSIMGSQGDAGQFRTPRHIIDFIVDIVKPTKSDTILDPACGTAGFLISAYKYIQKTAEETKQPLTPKERTTLTENIQGYDISPDMQKLALVNMYLHKFKDPKIYEYDTLTQDTRWDNYFDCILANPPFMTPKGGIQPHNKFGVKANRSEVLFVDYIMEHLNSTGRAGIIVPEGIVFQSANAYKELRKKLVEENILYAVVSLPSGVFQPYSGVKTSILLLDKQLAKKTDKILFVEIQNDGFDLGAQRREIDKNDLPEAIEIINRWQNIINSHSELDSESLIKSKLVTIVEKSKLLENGEYNLTASRYKVTQDFSNCKWDMVKIGDICKILSGYAFDSKLFNEERGFPIIRIRNIKPNKTTTLYNGDYDKNYIIHNGDLIIGMDGEFNHTLWNGGDALLNQRTCKLHSFKNVLKEWVNYFIGLKLKEIEDSTYAVTVKHISNKQIMNIEIPLPPLEVQEEIVKELDGYQAVIDGAQKVIDNWKPTLPINPNWEKVKLGDVAQIKGGKRLPKGEGFANQVTNHPYLRVVDFKENTIDTSDLKYIDDCIFNQISNYTISSNDVYISIAGTIGLTGIIPNELNGANLTENAAKIVINSLQQLSPKFLAYCMQTEHVQSQIKSLTHAVGVPKLALERIRIIEISCPMINEQQVIVSQIIEEENVIEECKKLIEIHKQKINNKIQSIWGDGCE